jgi:hypothetical protein
MTTKKTPRAVWAYYAPDVRKSGTGVALDDDSDREELKTLITEGRIRLLADDEPDPEKMGPAMPNSPVAAPPVVTDVPAEQRKAQASTK